VVQATEGWAGADLELVCKKAALLALEAARRKPSTPRITRRELIEAVRNVEAGAGSVKAARPAAAKARRSAG
jgi:SpoVK/Ycf46/Vps4 family AAA+-type ATPase